jgi:hypothetical protein
MPPQKRYQLPPFVKGTEGGFDYAVRGKISPDPSFLKRGIKTELNKELSSTALQDCRSNILQEIPLQINNCALRLNPFFQKGNFPRLASTGHRKSG